MREDHNWSRMALASQIGLQPVELVEPHVTHCINLHAVVQLHEMNAFVVEAVPAIAKRALAEAILVLRAIVNIIVLAGDIEDPVDLRTLDHLRRGIELGGLRILRNISRMYHEIRRLYAARDSIDLVDRLGQSACHIRVCSLVKSDVAVADLHEAEVLYLAGRGGVALHRLREQL